MVFTLLAAITITNKTSSQVQASQGTIGKVVKEQGAKAPKYIFLFIGDGMSYPQIQATSLLN